MDNDDVKAFGALLGLILFFLLGIFCVLAAYAKYNLWASGLHGQAELKRAEWNRQIQVREAQARLDGASLLAQAEVERAKGVAQANKIIGDSLRCYEGFLRYLWIDSLQHTRDQIIYIPTEANLPILEASRKTMKSEKLN